MSGIKPTNPSPTGGGMMPPTSEAQPLPETPKAVSPKQDTGGFLDSIIPKVNAMSDDEIMKGINSGKYDDTINQLSKE